MVKIEFVNRTQNKCRVKFVSLCSFDPDRSANRTSKVYIISCTEKRHLFIYEAQTKYRIFSKKIHYRERRECLARLYRYDYVYFCLQPKAKDLGITELLLFLLNFLFDLWLINSYHRAMLIFVVIFTFLYWFDSI